MCRRSRSHTAYETASASTRTTSGTTALRMRRRENDARAGAPGGGAFARERRAGRGGAATLGVSALVRQEDALGIALRVAERLLRRLAAFEGSHEGAVEHP